MSTTRLYPFVDIPNHLAQATIIKSHGELTNKFDQYYSVDMFLKPNVFYLFFCTSKIFPSVEFANKIFYCVYVVLFPLSVFMVIKKIGGNPWFALLSFLFIYNYSVCYGFVGYTIAIPFVILIFYFILGDFEDDKAWKNILLSSLFVLLFFIHALAAIFSLLIFFCALFAGKGRLQEKYLGNTLYLCR
jgi:hypothetical protein